MDRRTMKRHSSSSLDRVSDSPSRIIQNILMFLPLRDMVRTSVLSKNWRSHWVKVPQLVFDEELREFWRRDDTSIVTMHRIFGILLLHQGPILKFKLDMSLWRCCCCSDISKIIPLLSRNGIEDLTIVMGGMTLPAEDSYGGHHECDNLPSSIYSCSELKHLSLTRCGFKPLTLLAFKKLISIELINIHMNRNVVIPCGPLLETLKLETHCYIDSFSVDAPNLKSFYFRGCISSIDFMNTPLLKYLSLRDGDPRTFDLNKLLPSLPLLENIYLAGQFHQFLVQGESPDEHPIVLNNLRILELSGFDVKDMHQLSSTLLWIRRQPILQKLKFSDVWPTYWRKSEPNFQKLLYCDYSLMKLRGLEFDFIDDMRPCVEFIKFLLTISPELETLSIRPPYGIEVVDNAKILFELACSRRASSKAEVVCFDLDWNMM